MRAVDRHVHTQAHHPATGYRVTGTLHISYTRPHLPYKTLSDAPFSRRRDGRHTTHLMAMM